MTDQLTDRPVQARIVDDRTNPIVEVDGHRIEGFVRGYTITGGVDLATRLELDLVITEATQVDGPAMVYMRPGTDELLKRAGWRPPGTATIEDIATDPNILEVLRRKLGVEVSDLFEALAEANRAIEGKHAPRPVAEGSRE